MDDRTLEVSILLTTYNRENDCITCLNTLIPQIIKDIEVFLLDDWHIESNILKQYCKENNINYIHTGIQKDGKVKWRVPGFAYNIGAKLAKGKYFIIGGAEMKHLNNDCIQKMYIPNKVTAPTVYDQTSPTSFKNYKKLNNKLPFCFGLPKFIYYQIGGYDEDFTGYCFDDNDFSDRVLSLIPFEEIDAEVIHLWNPRGASNRGDTKITNRAWNHNKQLYMNRKNILVRNEGRDWGVL